MQNIFEQLAKATKPQFLENEKIKTPKEKANELYDKFYPFFDNSVRHILTKESALITINEIILALELNSLNTEYWEKVKIEINEIE